MFVVPFGCACGELFHTGIGENIIVIDSAIPDDCGISDDDFAWLASCWQLAVREKLTRTPSQTAYSLENLKPIVGRNELGELMTLTANDDKTSGEFLNSGDIKEPLRIVNNELLTQYELTPQEVRWVKNAWKSTTGNDLVLRLAEALNRTQAAEVEFVNSLDPSGGNGYEELDEAVRQLCWRGAESFPAGGEFRG